MANRILIATGIFPPEIGGPALYSEHLAEEFVKKGNLVTVITYGTNFIPSKKYQIIGVSRSWPYGLRQLIYFFWIFYYALGSSWIFAFDTLGAGLPAVLVGKILNKKVIIRLGGDFLWEKFIESGKGEVTMEEFYQKNLQKNFLFLFKLIKFTLRNAGLVAFT